MSINASPHTSPLLPKRTVSFELESETEFGGGGGCSSASPLLMDDSWMHDPANIPIREFGGDSATTPAALERIVHPPHDDFHRNEYGHETTCDKCAPDESKMLPKSVWTTLSFVVIGSGLRFSWNCIYLSEGYFETVLGKSVLGRLGLAEDLSTFVGMLLFVALRLKMPYRPSLLMTYGYMFTVCLVLTVLAATVKKIPPILLYLLIAGNGLSTGIAQAEAGALGGLFPGGSVDSLVLIGGSLASLGPTALQVSTLDLVQSEHTPAGMADAHKLQLYIVFSIGCVGLLLAFISTLHVTSFPVYKKLADAEQRRLRSIDKKIGKAKIRGRARIIWVHVASLVFNWIISINLTSISPYVPAAGDEPSPFWIKSLATVLIASSNLGYFIGNITARWLQPYPFFRSDPFLLLFGIARAGFVALIMLYINNPFAVPHGSSGVKANLFIIIVYFFIAATGGGHTNLTSSRCQQMCGFTNVHTCPIVGSLVWFGLQIGVSLGAATSLLPFYHAPTYSR